MALKLKPEVVMITPANDIGTGTMQCPHCIAQAEQHDNFCRVCGYYFWEEYFHD